MACEPKEIVKRYRGYSPLRRFNGLTRAQAYELERTAYERLASCPHVPSIVLCDDATCKLTLEHRGTSLDRLRRERKPVVVSDVDDQIRTIARALDEAGVVHLDVFSKNLCYDERTGRVSLIDFDMAVLDDAPMSETLRDLYERRKASGETHESLLRKAAADIRPRT